MKRITIEPVTRIEGHGKITINLNWDQHGGQSGRRGLFGGRKSAAIDLDPAISLHGNSNTIGKSAARQCKIVFEIFTVSIKNRVDTGIQTANRNSRILLECSR